MRAERLGAHRQDKLSLASSTSADDIATTISNENYALVIVDSIQTLSLNEISSAPGTVSQITNSCNVIIRAAKKTHTSVVLVGHVTKEGSIAGPKVLEHLVDVVLNFEGDRYGGFKVVRAVKNRYGSTDEAALMEMGGNRTCGSRKPFCCIVSGKTKLRWVGCACNIRRQSSAASRNPSAC